MMWIVFAIIVVSYANAISTQDCPNSIPKDTWTEVHGNVCYRFELDIKKEYGDAQDYCRRRGGNLVMIKSQEINDFITNKLSNKFGYKEEAWIGLNDIDDEGDFVWVDGNPMYYNNFAKGNGPDGGFLHFFRHRTEDCAAIHVGSGGKWKDYKCSDYFLGIKSQHKRFICEFQVDIPETTTAPTTTSTTFITTTTTTAIPRTTCPSVICELDCGMDGFKSHENCPICQCNRYDPSTEKEIDDTISSEARSISTSSTVTIPVLTSSSTIEVSTNTPCKDLVCELECGLLGFKKDINGCLVCECNYV